MSTPSSPASSAEPRRGAARAALRAATHDAHARLDALFGAFDLADPADYGRFLSAHARALSAVEPAIEAAGLAEALPDWPVRRRREAIAADLAALGLPVAEPLEAALPPGRAAAWGLAYVLEGSRLGGGLLARQVAPGLPRAYLAQPQPPGAWRKFLELLEIALYDRASIDRGIEGALAAFAAFEAAGKAAQETSPP